MLYSRILKHLVVLASKITPENIRKVIIGARKNVENGKMAFDLHNGWNIHGEKPEIQNKISKRTTDSITRNRDNYNRMKKREYTKFRQGTSTHEHHIIGGKQGLNASYRRSKG